MIGILNITVSARWYSVAPCRFSVNRISEYHRISQNIRILNIRDSGAIRVRIDWIPAESMCKWESEY